MLNKREIKLICYREYWEGAVRDSRYFGKFEVVEYTNSRDVRVRFLATGYEVCHRLAEVRKGEIKDKLLPSVAGVGYIGEGKYKPSTKNKHTRAYTVWKDMLTRCYSERASVSMPTYTDCTVNEEWYNFQNFARWFETNYIDGYQLDKDIKVKGNRIYGSSTCIFVSPQENTEAASAKHYTMVSPNGIVTDFYNITKFCKDRGLDTSCLIKVNNGERQHHKGWTRHEEENNNDM